MNQSPGPRRGPTAENIRSIFLRSKRLYSLSEVVALTDATREKLRREIAAGDRDAVKVDGKWHFTWRQLVFVAMDMWPLATIVEALGPDAATALPPLLSLRTIPVRLPEYVLRGLETVAADHGVGLDDALYGELIDFAGTLLPDIEREIPGYRRAYLFPGEE